MKDDADIRDLLARSRVIAMVGLSADERKPSNGVARYLQGKGFRVIPVNPGADSILGEKAYESLSDIPEQVDVVDIFMRPDRVLPVVKEAVSLGPKAIWLQLGIVSDEAKAAVAGTGIMFVQDRCMKLEHDRLL
jgi:uncharacterized protein